MRPAIRPAVIRLDKHMLITFIVPSFLCWFVCLILILILWAGPADRSAVPQNLLLSLTFNPQPPLRKLGEVLNSQRKIPTWSWGKPHLCQNEFRRTCCVAQMCAN